MTYRLLADGIVLLHLCFILFVIFGAVALYFRRGLIWFHLPAVGWAALIELNGGHCPLTPLEIKIREAAGQMGYEAGFIDHYIIPLIYPGEITSEVAVTLGIAVLLWNLLAYACIYRWCRRNG
ncbi:hypothetical protein BOW53_06920 [Solemya pervernicosa gill symbiont]|uniref:DUF2784 domain-containing protein n=2 Tax=Gammaproteobacteria incertae sedis TaxID=118884 RepID=A0A1T2L6I0_9GAMM|nr:DUF2784 domain-containing protein [Candidatus Reidiella endopervernicosa]OOZ40654.1 hypothetical protein BOW53_06920 [Solemya pervernicosa gill symbiont]QKQ27409.1 DUF2784 domain-containing protein [Candidatus Reidiella endopervernicosa]